MALVRNHRAICIRMFYILTFLSPIKVIEFLYFNHPEFDTLVTIEAESDEIVSAACNLVYASGSFNFFTWFRAFEADEWKDIYQTASNNMASYISAKQRAEEE